MSQCKAVVNGSPCRAAALKGNEFCYFHSPRPRQAPETILDWIADRQRFGRSFKDLSTWQNWIIFLKTLYGLPFDDLAELEAYRHFTGRMTPPEKPFDESWLLCGRRGGKSFICALIAAYEALAIPWAEHLAPGEFANIFILASDKAQSRNIYNFLRAMLRQAAGGLIRRDTKDEIELANQVLISIRAGDIRSLRGYAVCCALVDEACQLRDAEGGYANPLQEVLISLRPSLIRVPGFRAKLIGLSTPWGRWGVMFDQFQGAFGDDSSDVLCWRGASLEMNPTLDAKEIEKELKKDPARNRAEYLAEWRGDTSNLFHEDRLAAAMGDHLPRPYEAQNHYICFLDPSSLKGDSFTMAIGFVDRYSKQIVVVRAEERRPPGDVNDVVKEFAGIMTDYHIGSAITDAHASGWVESAFKKFGIRTVTSPLSKSEIYLYFAGLLAEGKVWMTYDDRAYQQFLSLERRITRGGAESVDHPAFGQQHDDLSNAIAGCAVALGRESAPMTPKEMEDKLKGEGPIAVPPDDKFKKKVYPPEWLRDSALMQAAKEMEDDMRKSFDGVCPIVNNRRRLE